MIIVTNILKYLKINSSELTDELKLRIENVKREIVSACRPKHIFHEIKDLSLFSSKDLKKHLNDCERFFLFAATLGTEADRILSRYSKTDITHAAIAQAVMASYIEEYADRVMDEFDKDGLFFKPRFSPGYGDLSITCQKTIIDITGADRKIGLTLTDSYMMVPEKSITAVLGLCRYSNCSINKCDSCPNKSCEYRKEENL